MDLPSLCTLTCKSRRLPPPPPPPGTSLRRAPACCVFEMGGLRCPGSAATACGNLNIRARVAACWPLIRTAPDAAAAAQGAEQAGFGPAVGRRCVRLPFENECACLFMCLTPWNRAQFCHQQVTEEAAAAAAGAGCCTQRRLWSGPLC